MFSFGDFNKLYYLFLIVPILVVISYLKYKRTFSILNKISKQPRNYSIIFGSKFFISRFILKEFCFIVSMVLLIVSLAKPRIGYEWKEVKTVGSDIMIALDLSKSMLAEDIAPNRLEVAKRKIQDLLLKLKSDRVGIVVFSGSAFVLCPLTLDYSILNLFLESLDYDSVLVSGTSLQEALEISIKSLKESSPEESSSSSIILITDGEDHGKNLEKSLDLAKSEGISIHSLGIGTEGGAPIPKKGGGFQEDKSGTIVVSKLDTKILEKISSYTNGVYVTAVPSDDDIDKIYYKGILKKDFSISKNNSDGEEKDSENNSFLTKEKVWNEKYGIFLIGSIIFLMIFFFIRCIKRDLRYGD